LCYQDFLQVILPCEDNSLRKETCDRPPLNPPLFRYLPRDIEVATATLLEAEMHFFKKMEIYKLEFENLTDFSLLAAFRTIDKFNVGLIDSICLGNYLK